MADLADAYNASYDAGFTVNAGAAVVVTVNGATLSAAQLAADFVKRTAGGVDTYAATTASFVGTETIAVSATLTDEAGNISAPGTLTLKPINMTASSAGVNLVFNNDVLSGSGGGAGSLSGNVSVDYATNTVVGSMTFTTASGSYTYTNLTLQQSTSLGGQEHINGGAQFTELQSVNGAPAVVESVTPQINITYNGQTPSQLGGMFVDAGTILNLSGSTVDGYAPGVDAGNVYLWTGPLLSQPHLVTSTVTDTAANIWPILMLTPRIRLPRSPSATTSR